MNEKLTKLREEEHFLKEILNQHVKLEGTIWKDRESEFKEHVDSILDELNEIRREINNILNDINPK
jgi:hypothetical protein